MISLLRGSKYIVAKLLAIGNAEISLARLVYKSIKLNQILFLFIFNNNIIKKS